MNCRLSNSLLFAIASLLAAPTLAEVTGLSGSAKADTAAEEDHTALRVLRGTQHPLLDFENLPTFQPAFPDVLPGTPLELPFGAFSSRSSEQTREVTTYTNIASQTFDVSVNITKVAEGEGGISVTTVEFTEELATKTTWGDEDNTFRIEENIRAPDKATIEAFEENEVSAGNQTATEETTLNTALDEEGITIYYNITKGSELSEGTELTRESILANVTSETSERTGVWYYYAEKSANKEEAEETIDREHEVTFASKPTPEPTPAPTT